MIAIEAPFPQFFDKDGSPLDHGYLYFGAPNQNPETNPVTVYWDTALTQPAAQPLRTLNGYIVRNGTAARVYTSADYSLTVRDRRGRLLPSAPNSADYSIISIVLALFTSLASSIGASLVGFIMDGAGAVLMTIQDALRETASTKRFGAKHDGVTDDTASVQAAITYCQGNGKALRVNAGPALVQTLNVSGSLNVVGDGSASILRHKAGYVGNMINVTGSGTTVSISNLTLDGQQTLQAANSTNDQIYSTATGVSGGKPFYLSVDNVDFVNTAYRGIAFVGDNDDTTREVGMFTRNRFRDGSVNAVNTTYTPIDIDLVNGVEATVDDNDFYFSAPPILPGGRCAVVVAQTQTVTPYFTRPTITNNRMNYRGCNELASLGAIDLYIWSGLAIVESNVLTNSTASAIKLKGNSFDLSVVNNKIDGAYGTGGALPTFSAITISNPNYGSAASQFLVDSNQISNWNAGATIGVISVATYDGAQFSKNVVISKNQLAGVTGIGIDINNCQDAEVIDNQIDGRSTVTTGIRALQCDGNLRIKRNKVANPTLYHIYVDTPLTAALDVIADDNTLLGANGTYAMYLNCRHAITRQNTIIGGFHGINFAGTTRTAVAKTNTLTNMAGTVGINVSSTAIVNVVARANEVIDSATITTNAFTVANAPTLIANQGNSWNGNPRLITAATATVGVNDGALYFATSAACTVTLPSATANPGLVLVLRNTAAFAINSASSNVVPLAGGAATTAILSGAAGKWAQLRSDGTSWNIEAAN
jgi:hypothetical protein